MGVSLVRSYVYYLGWPVTGDYQASWTWAVMIGAVLRVAGIVAAICLWRDRRIWAAVAVFVSLTFVRPIERGTWEMSVGSTRK